ncbi:MAG TPA: hypothetical protein VH206_08430, partial [Xanthobacteraceae bacterium]|nr:hypothetical protein [Xanthobacteraceae bacterium]
GASAAPRRQKQISFRFGPLRTDFIDFDAMQDVFASAFAGAKDLNRKKHGKNQPPFLAQGRFVSLVPSASMLRLGETLHVQVREGQWNFFPARALRAGKRAISHRPGG